MKKILQQLTDKVTTKKGVRITIAVWIAVMVLLSMGPSASEFKVTNFESLPADAPSIIAEEKMEQYFPNDQGIPAILVFHEEEGMIQIPDVLAVMNTMMESDIEHVEWLDLSRLPEAALRGFVSEDESTMIIPVTLEPDLDNRTIGETVDQLRELGNHHAGGLSFYVTGPAGIAGDTLKLFEQADFVLLMATIGIILILLILIYRSPLLALIPLLATAIVYQVVNQVVGLLGLGGLEINNSTTSIMSILLFAAVIDYSLFVFSRYREELVRYESKHEAMKETMRSIGMPVFIAGGTVLAAMLVLFAADFRDYSNFAPVFGTTMFIIMMASVTLVPALFTAFGRRSFWPKVPKFNEAQEIKHGIWGPVAKFVTNKPAVAGIAVLVLLIATALNSFNLKFEFDMVKSFPETMDSRVGYEIVEARYDKGELAPSTVLFVSDDELTREQFQSLSTHLREQPDVASVRLSGIDENNRAAHYNLAFDISPYSVEAVERLEEIREQSAAMLEELGLSGELHFSGTTASLADERNVNKSDIYKIVILETLLILVLLFGLTRSFKMPFYMMATILLSYASALGIGLFLVDLWFGIDAISTRVPVYAFVFLVALGIDYNIIMVSRFLEERKKHQMRDALEIAVRNTGGVISSAGIILAATFAALMTMPIADLFVFGFIVALGILMDTFLVRGLLLPSLIMFFEKDRQKGAETESVRSA